ncbi:hypothetical protein R3P38DRAFT_890283 [Favolaschia claudopus]|uniref:Uncharacterized protein n=1 Tax=Favolaschia claudopus TaxID=2862362 RepID=A0AAW0BT20_9AGAR
MELETDSPEAFTDLRDIFSASGTTLNVWGGIGGQGGRGGQDGGTGGNGEGTTFNVSRAERLIVHVNDRRASKNSRTLDSAGNSAPPEFSICDINLQREVHLTDSRVCFRRRKRDVVRRYHAAEVNDRKDMTVVVYEGADAEEEFKKDVARSMKFRHPSFLQLYGTVHSGNNYASIFYDVLLPWRDIKSNYRQSPMVFCYMFAYVTNEFDDVSAYFQRRFGSGLYGTGIDYTLFLRPSSGRLCIDLGGSDISNVYIGHHYRRSNNSTVSPNRRSMLEGLYHTTEYHNLGNPVVIAPMLDIDDCVNLAWYLSPTVGSADPHITESGWKRFAVSELIGRESGPEGKFELYLRAELQGSDLWLSQANHVLNWLGVFSNADNYVLLYAIRFVVELEPQSARPTDWYSLDGFLFLCPLESFRVGPASLKCPDCEVGYWSLDPLGVDRLSGEQTSELGFPTITISLMEGFGLTWGDTIYAGLRQFHQGKGFDPDSQDLARYLGYPLYELYSDYDDSMNVDDGDFGAHIEEVSSTDTDQPMDVD